MRNQSSLSTMLVVALALLTAPPASAQDAPIPTVDQLARLAASAASTGDAARLHEVGMLQIQSEEFAAAVGTLRALGGVCARSVAVSNNIAVALAAAGDYAGALRELEQLSGALSTAEPRIADTVRANRATIAKTREFRQDKSALPVTDAVDLRLLDDVDSCPGLSPPPAPEPPSEFREESLPSALPEEMGDEAASGEEASEEGEDEPDPVEAVLEAVAAWAEAWQGRQVDDYLAAYSDRFTPADGASRADWATRKRRLITAATSIQVIIGDEDDESVDDVMLISDTVAQARFRQTYRSDTLSDKVNKTLVFALENGTWRIVSEAAEPVAE